MYVFIRSGVLLWREVWSKLFKLTRTFFFLSFRSGTLSSEALHPPTLLPHPPLHYPSGGFTILVSITLLLSTSALPSLSLYTSLFAALSPLRSLLAIVPSRGVEFEIATLFRLFSRPMISRLCDPRDGISIWATLWYLRQPSGGETRGRDKRGGEVLVDEIIVRGEVASLVVPDKYITSLFLNYYFRVIWISYLDNSRENFRIGL